MFILAWARTYDMKYIILRPTNNYGIGQYPEKLIPVAVKMLKRGKKIRLHDQGEPVRNWLHADDTASAVISNIESGNYNEIYNVAGGFEQKNLDTVKKIIKCYYGNCDKFYDLIDLNHKREGQDVRYALNDNKIRILGWQPKKSFDQELPKIIKYYKQNFKW